MVEKKRVAESSKAEKGQGTALPTERQCAHRFADGRQCRRRRWAGKEVCYLHDKTRLGAQKLKEGSKQSPGFTVAQLQELLAMAMGQVLFGKMPVGQAYALGYLAQQSLAATAAAAKEKKVDVKHFWEMVDMGATFERAAELSKERKRQRKESKEAEEAEEAMEAEDPPTLKLRRAGPPTPRLPSTPLATGRRAGAEEEFTAEDTDDAEGRKGGEETADGG